MLLYLDGTVVPMKVIKDIQWMVRWRVLVEFGPQSHNGHPVHAGLDSWVLVPFAQSVVPSLDRLARAPTCSGSSINDSGLLVYLASLMHDCDPLSFCHKHAQTFLGWQVRYCTCLKTRPLGLCAGYRSWMFLPQPHNTAALKQVQE
jgi:hypothetical protein